MYGGTNKYSGDQDPRWHDPQYRYVYPGTSEGYPFRVPHGDSPPLPKDNEYRNTQVQFDFRCGIFHTWDNESFGRYQELCDRIINGQFRLIQRLNQESKSDDGRPGWTFYIEWAQPYGTVAPKQQPPY